MSNYVSASQQRILKLQFKLAGNELYGISLADITKAMQEDKSKIFKDLKNLEEAGIVDQTEDGNWKLSPRLAQIAFAVSRHYEWAQKKVDEIKNRYTRDIK